MNPPYFCHEPEWLAAFAHVYYDVLDASVVDDDLMDMMDYLCGDEWDHILVTR